MIKSTDLAYAAGYIDGDGCFYIDKFFVENRFKHRCLLAINSTEIENLQWFQRIFGGYLSSKPSINGIHKPLHRFVIQGKNMEVLKNIKPYLIEKIDEFNLFEKFRDPNNRELADQLISQMYTLKNHANLIPNSIKNEVESIKNSIIPTVEDFAYLAGFIDSEGCLRVQKCFPKAKPNPTYKILLQCNNTKSPCFFWLSQRFGGNFHFIDRSKYHNQRNQMTWRLSSASLFKILPKIYPFLIHKKPICEQLIKFSETIVPLTGNFSRRSAKFAEFYQPILDEREKIFHKITTLNKKGI